MPKGFHSSAILVIVFVLGLVAGIAGMVWAWPGVQARYFTHKRETYVQHLQTTLQLTPQQVTQVEGVIQDAGQLRHSIHLQYAPQYHAMCEQAYTLHQQERDSYLQSPQRKLLLDRLHRIMTASQWQKWQQPSSTNNHRARPDPCEHSRSRNPRAAGSSSGR
ncbi:MAG: hypothetical protein EPN33_04800 [Acidobacteria bacterium]|nr:MAG: hypothetical protein EPN33_04800 [Acidobacteriota bacterium]